MTQPSDIVERLEDNDALSHEWLSSVGFKSHQHERQPHKHWKLLLGRGVDGGRFSTPDDLYIEVTPAWWIGGRGDKIGDPDAWHCWLGGMNSSFLHVRYFRTIPEFIALVEAITGLPWAPENHLYGMLHTAERGAQLRAEYEALQARAAPKLKITQALEDEEVKENG